MPKFKPYFLLVFIIFVNCGLNTGSYVITQQPTKKLSDFQYIEIAEVGIQNNMIDNIDSRISVELRTLIVEQLEKGKIYKKVSYIETEETKDVLKLELEITKFNKGNKTARLFFGFWGAGKAEMMVHCKCFDKLSNSLISEADISGYFSSSDPISNSMPTHILMSNITKKIISFLKYQ